MGTVNSKSISPFGSIGSFVGYDRIIHHLSPGDLIEVQRNKYKHWIVFEKTDHFGNVWCFHVTAVGQQTDYNDFDVDPIPGVRKELSFNGKAVLKYEPLEDILKDNGSLFPSLCRINNQQLMAQKMLKTVRNAMPDMDQVFQTLHRLKDNVLQYDLKSLNCEHYCTLWKYGIGWSSQVNSFKDIITAALKMTASMTGMAADFARANGCYRMGIVCLIISSVASMAAKVVEGIDFTLNGLKLEAIVRQAIAY